MLSLALGLASYVAAGATLGLWFAGVLLATLVTPPLVLAHVSLARRAFAGGAVVDGIGLIWLVAAFRSETSLGEWLACYLVLAAHAFALATLAMLLCRIGVNVMVASALAVVVGLLWLTWPVWLAPYLSGDSGAAVVGWLAPAHPLIAINGVLQHLGVWGEQRLAYHLTNLGQDVPYEFPPTILPAMLAHVIVGAAFGYLSTTPPRGKRHAPAPPAGSLQ